MVTNLRYADDIVLIASSKAELQEIVTRLHCDWAACELSMKINVKKTEMMKADDDLTPMKVTVAGVYLRQVHSFKYLGAYFNSDSTCTQEIKSRLAIGRERMAQLNTLWRSRAISNPHTHVRITSHRHLLQLGRHGNRSRHLLSRCRCASNIQFYDRVIEAVFR